MLGIMSVPVRADNEDVTVYRQIFAIATTYVQTHGAGLKTFQKSLYDWPRLRQVSERSPP